jgi:hypothetical protein
MKLPMTLILLASTAAATTAFVTTPSTSPSCVVLHGWFGGGSGKDRLDEEWEKQQAILKQRRAPKAERDAYFENIEKRRAEATKKQQEMWGWQSKQYGKGEDPLDEWKKRRSTGQISDLEDQYGDPKKIGGIPLPMP